ncbi:type VI secretion system baseplate subunit TssK [Rubellimicrobium arenae]|uniref:type VI secretion system baseplate subunit TssK n=1 Tax=Rubellimicrobium arenae TaxID=2817372 RepID=UPI0034A51770
MVWSEGLFLRTQHFQQQDRFVEALVRGSLRAAHLQAWGFSALALDEGALRSGRVGLSRAIGLFPDGTPFAIPGDALPPEGVAVRREGAAGFARIGIPAERPGTPTTEPAHSAPGGARYRGALVTVRDAVRGGAEPTEIEVASLTARLFVPGEDTAGYVTMPVARIEGLAADGSVRLAPGFLPPALVTAAAPWYAAFAQEVATGLERIAEAHGRMVLGGTGRSVENLLILELANAAGPRIAHMAAQDLYHPADLYMELAGLAGRMATYGSSSRRLSELATYAHEDPEPAFSALADTLRSLMLSLRHVEPKSRALPVAVHSENIWKVRIDNPEILKSSRIVVRVASDLSEALLRRIFVDQATVGAADEFEKLWRSRLPGIPLRPLHSQPREIPYDGDRLCLELDRKSEHWGHILESPGFVIGVSGQLERQPVIDCYAVSQ